MFYLVHALWRRLSQLLRCSDGSVSVTLVVQLACLVLQDDILLLLCPVATEELLFCLNLNQSVHTPGHAPTWLLPQQRRACPSSWSPAPSSRVWLQKKRLLPRGNTRSVAQLRRFPNTPGLRRNLESFKSFLAKPYFGRVQLCFRCLLHIHWFCFTWHR